MFAAGVLYKPFVLAMAFLMLQSMSHTWKYMFHQKYPHPHRGLALLLGEGREQQEGSSPELNKDASKAIYHLQK